MMPRFFFFCCSDRVYSLFVLSYVCFLSILYFILQHFLTSYLWVYFIFQIFFSCFFFCQFSLTFPVCFYSYISLVFIESVQKIAVKILKIMGKKEFFKSRPFLTEIWQGISIRLPRVLSFYLTDTQSLDGNIKICKLF